MVYKEGWVEEEANGIETDMSKIFNLIRWVAVIYLIGYLILKSIGGIE